MEQNDFCYLLMSSLKHPYREYTTKESTSLLMKELDQAASSVVVHHPTRSNQQSTLDYGNNHRHHHFNNQQDGLTFGSPKSPDNVARTILRVWGGTNEDRTAPRNDRRRSASSSSFAQSPAAQLTNGHHHHHYKKQQQPPTSSSLLNRCRGKLHLQLYQQDGAATGSPSPADNQQKYKKYPSSRQQAVCLANNGDHQSPFSPSDEPSLPSTTIPFVTWPFKPIGKDESLEEHELIARNSSLLMVKPTSDPTTSSHHPDEESIPQGSSDSSPDSFAPPPPAANVEQETAILDSESQHSEKEHAYLATGAERGEYTTGNVFYSSVEHHPRPGSSHQIAQRDTVTPSGTISSNEQEQSPELFQQITGPGLTAATAEHRGSVQRIHNRLCTSYRLKVPLIKNPVDLCLLPSGDVAIADYDNGLVIINDLGEIIDHKKSYREVNACGVDCVRTEPCSPSFRIFLLVVRDGTWTINVYRNMELMETARCPGDAQIENWALRRLVVCVDTRLHLLASGENKSTIWTYEFDKGEWRVLLSEHSGGRKATSGNYNDMSVKYNKDTKETRIVLCEWKKAQLWTLFLNDKTDVMEEKSIKMKRVKGQEWIVQGPRLALLDEQADIIVYDGSGKVFLFDGDTYRCKKIIADLGKGEVSALAVAQGWMYALCRYKKCIEAYMYKEQSDIVV